MDISQLMRGHLADSQPADIRPLELKPGQHVRGVVLKTFDRQEALLLINGTKVMARIETPMQAGQSAVFQVQPESSQRLVVLKMAENGSAAGLTGDFWNDWPKHLGISERIADSLDLALELRQAGMATNRETAQALKTAMQAMPPGTDVKTWLQSAVAALARGLPMTEQTIGALKQVIFGKPAHVLLQEIEKRLTDWLASTAGESGLADAAEESLRRNGNPGRSAASAETSPDSAIRTSEKEADAVKRMQASAAVIAAENAESAAKEPQAQAKAAISGVISTEAQAQSKAAPSGQASAARLLDLLAEGEIWTGGAQRQSEEGAAGSFKAVKERGITNNETNSVPAGIKDMDASFSRHSSGGTDSHSLAGSTEKGWIGSLLKWLGADHERNILLRTENAPLSSSLKAGAETGETIQNELNDAAAKGLESVPSAGAGNAAGTGANAQVRSGTDGVPNVLPKVDSETLETIPDAGADGKQMMKAVALANLEREPGGPMTASGSLGSVLSGDFDRGKPSQESVKSLLLSLVSSGDLPPALKESAQQLISHITGQQLLLAPERNGAFMSHVTLFVPLRGPDGEQTASVHIQSRRSRKGELDAANCRLVFDLSMKTLGNMIVDVQVADNIVSLQMMNDHPALAEQAETAREELKEAFRNNGYQLLSLRTVPLPHSAGAAEGGGLKQVPPENGIYSAKPYKGVDYRI
ncbi:flagellar hook-length control protein FliK [Paenibacillus beijingensis]|uniref:Flagellar hook-length control protein-like C-terminal domain-containing protein n=1 Tax=Paenibacillus beijingensis TaxID=1126833 RepID=A0A0D5NNQ5_9BACL|nr:flagellar hook-length control protein FliK [Paenibacillus beijingensis]AJY76553.1 hypothetical protein VN24_20760 [Paenibacillus beijingensis]